MPTNSGKREKIGASIKTSKRVSYSKSKRQSKMAAQAANPSLHMASRASRRQEDAAKTRKRR